MLRRESDKNEALVNYQDIVFGKILGSGRFGEVYQGTWRHSDVAIKKLLIKQITTESAQEFEAESQIMARLRFPNIVQFYGYAVEPERCIVMEYCPNGSLYSVLHSNQPLEWTVRIKIALGTAKGLAFLHEEKILHRDIKSLNILLTEHFEAKLTDFGLSKLKAESKSKSSAHKSGKGAVGTIAWMAPELFNRRAVVFTEKSDIYSLGVTFWELTSRQIPFASAPSPDVIPMWVKEGEREEIPADCPPAFGSLIQQCWAAESSARPDSNSIVTQLKNSLEGFSAQKISKASSHNPSPTPASSGPQYLSNLVSEGSPKPLVFSPPLKPQPVPQIKQASPQEGAVFVRLVAEGEQEQAEALLQKDATLALFSSDVTDLSGRTFNQITGFQYAVWALDWHMWTMILKYLPQDQAAEQIKAMDKGSWVSQHRKSGDWLIQNLVDALQKYIDLYNQSKYSEIDTQWQTKVGGTQRLLPVHVINEYCHPNRPFKPCPDFTQSAPLPRTRKIDKGEWFTATYGSSKLGEKFAVLRYALGCGWGLADRGGAAYRQEAAADHIACHTLLVTRVQQRDQLIAELLNSPKNTNNAPSPNPLPYPAPSEPKYVSNLVSEDVPKPLVFSLPPQPKQPVLINTPRPQPASLIKHASPQAVFAFVRLIVEGEQDQAEALLQKDDTLALLPSDVTDLSGRTFKGITGFQYAVWALDWHMWTMISKYLPKDQAVKQINIMNKGAWVKEHRKSGDWLIKNLIDALETQIGLLKPSTFSKSSIHWKIKVGGAQRLLPVHVINEYCHPTRPFDPCPDFTKFLPRTRKVEDGEWFSNDYKSIGKYTAAYRHGVIKVSPDMCGFGYGSYVLRKDQTACQTLLEVRIQQRDQLIAELTSTNRRSYK